MINIGKRRECFFDTYLINEEETTASLRLHSPIKREIVINHNEEWEGDGCDFHSIFFDDEYCGADGKANGGVYRLYYLGWKTRHSVKQTEKRHPICVCYAESTDGINFTKPSLGLYELEGSYDNNIVLDNSIIEEIDNFFVFRDDSPHCPEDERYKGIAAKLGVGLYCCPSPDGIHFKLGEKITDKGTLDSLNIIFYDKEERIYRGYIRGEHVSNITPEGKCRDILYIQSKDFKTWTDPVPLEFDDEKEIELYTNCAIPYFRAPHMYLSFPSRYVNRGVWTPNHDELGGKELRLERSELEGRFGIAVTDCAFMVSRDGVNFKRYNQAFMRPDVENGRNWVYGDCYPARGFALTSSMDEGAPDEISMYCYDCINSKTPHSTEFLENGTSQILVQFRNLSTLKNDLKYLEEFLKQSIISGFVFKKNDPDYAELLDDIICISDDSQIKDISHDYYITANIYRIIALLHKKQFLPIAENSINLDLINRILPIFKYIENNFNEPLTLDVLAGVLNLNKDYFCRLFKKATSTTAIDYLNFVRICKAEELFKTEMNITEISNAVGFSSLVYFNRIFKKYKQSTPTSYRKIYMRLSDIMHSNF